MSLKRINPIEQHIEKVVVGVVAVVFLGAVASQFLLNPNEIDVGGGRRVPPGQAFEALEAEARDLRAKMDVVNVTPPDLPPVTLLDDFERRQVARVTPRERFAFSGKPLTFEGIDTGVDTGIGGDRIAWPALPAPTNVIAAQAGGTLDPFFVAGHPEIEAALPSVEQPIDVSVVTVEGEFSVESLQAALQLDPDGAGGELKPMPGGWWREGMEVFAVRLERQEMISHDVWGEIEVVPPLPGQMNVLETTDEYGGRALMSDMILTAQDYASEIRHPAFFPLIAGPEWMPPRELKALHGEGDVQEQIQAALRDLRRLEYDKASVEQSLQELSTSSQQTPPGVQPGGRPGVSEPPRTTAPATRDEARRQLLQRRLDSINERIGALQQRLIDLGHDPSPEEARGESATAYTITEANRLLDNQQPIRVWAHDMTAGKGRTYRYRLVLELSNPMFGRAAVLPEDQREYSERLTIATAPSEWTEPIEVYRDKYYFVSSAKPESDGALGSRKATVDVFEFYYGFWRKGTVTLDPGDFVRASVELPELFTYEVTETQSEAPPGQPVVPAPGREETVLVPPPGVQPPPGAPGASPTPAVPEKGKALPKERQIVVDVQLLDVAPPVRNGDSVRVVFVDPIFGLVTRTPEGDRRSELLARLEDSAKAGRTQGAPLPEPEPQVPTVPRREERRPEPPPPPAGGGGGGGGGGG